MILYYRELCLGPFPVVSVLAEIPVPDAASGFRRRSDQQQSSGAEGRVILFAADGR